MCLALRGGRWVGLTREVRERRRSSLSHGEHFTQPDDVEDATNLLGRGPEDKIAADLALALKGNHKLPKAGRVDEVEVREIQDKGGNLVGEHESGRFGEQAR